LAVGFFFLPLFASSAAESVKILKLGNTVPMKSKEVSRSRSGWNCSQSGRTARADSWSRENGTTCRW
jgi:hypothetical protein